MSPFIGKEREASGEEIEREFSSPGFHRILKEPRVYVDVTPEGEGSLWFFSEDLAVVSEEEGRVKQLVPKIPLEKKEGKDVVLYDSSGERVRIGWEPSEEDKLRRIRNKVWEEIAMRKEERYLPTAILILSRWHDFKSARTKSLKDQKLLLREKVILEAMGSGAAIGAGIVGIVEYLLVYPRLAVKDLITGYWAKEKARLTTQYLSELEAEKESSEDRHL